MAVKRNGLGRGLESLFVDNSVEEISSSSNKLKLMEIEPNHDQPRKTFEEKALSAQTNLFHFSSDISYIFQTSYKYNKNINIIE